MIENLYLHVLNIMLFSGMIKKNISSIREQWDTLKVG